MPHFHFWFVISWLCYIPTFGISSLFENPVAGCFPALSASLILLGLTTKQWRRNGSEVKRVALGSYRGGHHSLFRPPSDCFCALNFKCTWEVCARIYALLALQFTFVHVYTHHNCTIITPEPGPTRAYNNIRFFQVHSCFSIHLPRVITSTSSTCKPHHLHIPLMQSTGQRERGMWNLGMRQMREQLWIITKGT